MSAADLWERIRPSYTHITSHLWWGRILVVSAVFLTLLDAIRLTVWPQSYRAPINDFYEAVVLVLGALACGFAARRSSKLTRGLWAMTAAYLALGAAGDFHDFLVDIHFTGAALLHPLEFLGWCTYLPLALLIVFPTLEEGQLRWKWLPAMDFVQVAIAVALANFRFIYLPHLYGDQSWRVFGGAELVRNVLIAAGLLLRGAVEPSRRGRAIYQIVGGAFATITLLKGIAPVYAVVGRPAALLAIGVFAAYWSAGSDKEVEAAPEPKPAQLRLALSVAAAATLAVVLLLASGGPEQYRWEIRLIVAISIGLFIVRASLADDKRYAVEKELRKSERDLNRAQAVAHIGSWRCDLQRRTLALSAEAYRILGLPPGSLVTLDAGIELLHADDRDLVGKAYQAALESGSYDTDSRVWVDGRARWVNVQANLETDAKGDPVAAVGTVQDITERKLAQERLQEFERVVEGVEDGIIVLDRNYHYVLANRTFLGYRGLRKEQLMGHSIAELMKAESFETTRQKLEECFQGKIVQYEKRYEYPALGERDFSVSYFPIEGPTGVERVACVFRDISERRKTAEALHEREEKFHQMADNIQEIFWMVDASSKQVLYVSPAFEHITGRTVASLMEAPLSYREIIHPDDRVHVLSRLDEAVGTGVFNEEFRIIRLDGAIRWVGTQGFPVRDAEGTVYRLAGVVQDITERRRAEEARRESEDRYRDLVEHSEDLVCTHDLEGRLLSVNPAPARVLGYEVSELMKMPMRDLIAPEFRQQFDQYLERIKTKGSDKGLLCVVTRSGERRIWEYNNTLRTEGVGVPIVRGIAHDITERKRAEEALRESEERFRSLYENATIGLYRTTSDGEILLANPSLVKMLGFSSFSELRGRNLEAEGFEPGYDRAEFQRRLAAEGEVRGLEASWTKEDGTAIFVRESAKAIRNTEGKITHYEGTVEDITERKRAEESRRQSDERFRVALKDSPITVFSQDRDLRYTWVYNPRLCWQREIVGKTDEEILGAEQARRLVALKQRVLEAGTGMREEFTIQHSGRKYSFDITLEPLRDKAGGVAGITGAAMDIARLRELADGLQRVKDRLVQEKQYLESEIQTQLGFENIIGHSPELRNVLNTAKVVAPTDSTVLLLGETGTGKELVARAIHALSSRHDKNFIKLNCAAVPTGLLESELFGHEKGAFTSAVSQKVGRIELADKGTLFLDEIGELPLELQPKLLRVLQDQEFERLGGVRTLRVDVRVISATNRDLKKDVADKRFREDLFYRLNVFPISLPALRERRTDIPVLVQHFVQKHAGRMMKNIETIPDKTMTALENWSWPGNIRELENMIERMVILTKGRVLAPPPIELVESQELSSDDLGEMEREHIIRILQETNGMLSGAQGAASRLGIKRTTLQSMLKRLGIEPQEFRRGTGTYGE